MTRSNQYPRLAWMAEQDATSRPAYVARPHDSGWARVYLHRTNVDGKWWSWTVHWPDRFSDGGMVLDDRQEAADKATVAYWDAIEATEGWMPAPAPPPPPEDLMKVMFMRRFHTWVESRASKTEIGDQLRRYGRACTRGRPIISKDMDRLVWAQLTQAWSQFDFRVAGETEQTCAPKLSLSR